MADKILVCLISEQHVPNLLSVHHLRPDRLVLVVSGQMAARKMDSYFTQALEHGGLTYAPHVCKIDLEDSVEQTYQVLRAAHARLASSHPGAEWTVNYTGATKPMSIGAHAFAREIGAQPLYINFSRPNLLLFPAADPGGRTERCTHELGVREFLAGYGFEDRRPEGSHLAAAAFARATWECARVLASRDDDEDVVVVTNEERAQARARGLDLLPRHTAHLVDAVKAALAAQFTLTDGAAGLTGHITSDGGKFLTGGWLEVFLFGLLDRHATALGCSDVRLGVLAGKDRVENDLDVAFMRAFGLTWIECKTGRQAHDPVAEARFKVEAVTGQFRALRARAILASTSNNILQANGTIKPSVTWRAELCQYHVVARDGIRSLAAEPDNLTLLRTTLFGEPCEPPPRNIP